MKLALVVFSQVDQRQPTRDISSAGASAVIASTCWWASATICVTLLISF